MNKKNCKSWLKAAGIRTIKTMAETALALIGTNTAGITDVDWRALISVAALAGIVTVLSCIKGLPEIELAQNSGENLSAEEKRKLARDRREYENFMTYNGDEQ